MSGIVEVSSHISSNPASAQWPGIVSRFLLFQPVKFDARMLEQIDLNGGRDNVDFCMIDHPFESLKRGQPLARTQLAKLISANNESFVFSKSSE